MWPLLTEAFSEHTYQIQPSADSRSGHFLLMIRLDDPYQVEKTEFKISSSLAVTYPCKGIDLFTRLGDILA